MEEKVKQIMASVFGVQKENITDNASPDTIENWDSLRHMNLVVALEEEFNVSFSDDQMSELLNFPLIILTLNELINA
jgi:acyl carrier protein